MSTISATMQRVISRYVGAPPIALSPDGATIATVTGSVVTLWDAASGEQLRELPAAQGDVATLAFSADGGLLARAADGIDVWDVRTSKQIMRFGQGVGATALAFSPSGEMLASGDETTVRVWDVSSGAAVAELPSGSVYTVAFDPNGTRLFAMGPGDPRLRIWSLPPTQDPADAAADLCARVRRSLTSQEWDQFVPDQPYRSTCPGSPG